jgi:hypothetical protein
MSRKLFKLGRAAIAQGGMQPFVNVSSILARILKLKMLFQENGHSSFTPKRLMDD